MLGDEEQKFKEFSFEGPFKKYDVMTEIGVDAQFLLPQNYKGLKEELNRRIRDVVLPLRSLDSGRVAQIERELSHMNEKQMIDLLIENLIEIKCQEPSFIMNHPIIMSPLAKSHA